MVSVLLTGNSNFLLEFVRDLAKQIMRASAMIEVYFNYLHFLIAGNTFLNLGHLPLPAMYQFSHPSSP